MAERNQQVGLVELGLTLAEAEQLTTMLQAKIVSTQVMALCAFLRA